MKNFNNRNDKLKLSEFDFKSKTNKIFKQITTTQIKPKQFNINYNIKFQLNKYFLSKTKSFKLLNLLNAKTALTLIKLPKLKTINSYNLLSKKFEKFLYCVTLKDITIFLTKVLREKFWPTLSKLNSLKRRV